ncbi:MAG TPA: hypothetical protein VFC84_17055 [Desulfosporosinus sp.]|nr:hypothetical protein [Desulfosporosinus sp.]
MPEKQWIIKFKDSEHRITLHHGTIVRKYNVELNGDPIKALRTIIEKGDKLTFNINSHTCVLIIHFVKGGGKYKYDCIVDGTSVETQQVAEIPPEWNPPKQGCLKQIFMQISSWIGLTIVIGIISVLTGFSSDKIDLIIGLVVGAIIIYAVLRHLLMRNK